VPIQLLRVVADHVLSVLSRAGIRAPNLAERSDLSLEAVGVSSGVEVGNGGVLLDWQQMAVGVMGRRGNLRSSGKSGQCSN
jgi:hypothetical protein